jgi:hypothetical protein
MLKAMKSLLRMNLQTSQIKKKEQTRSSDESKSWESSAHSRTTYWQTHENDDDDDDETIDKELERVQQKIQQLQKEKEKFASQLQAKRKASES